MIAKIENNKNRISFQQNVLLASATELQRNNPDTHGQIQRGEIRRINI